MAKKGSNFQIGIIVFFIIAALLAVAIFAGVIPLGNKSGTPSAAGTVTIWGTLPSKYFFQAISDYNTQNQGVHVEYVEKDLTSFDADFINALAAGNGPDAILFPSEYAWRYKDKLVHVPFASFPLRKFQDSYIEEGSLLLDTDGVLAFPTFVDPLVMYYNRDLFTEQSIVYPPKTWDELSKIVPTLTKKNLDLSINQSAVAMGTFDNVSHAKDLMSLLILETGNPITKKVEGNPLLSTLNDPIQGEAQSRAISALNFYTAFANPVKDSYSWNRALPVSRTSFVSGKLAMYFGLASELPGIRAENPNLNFDVAPMPVGSDASSKVTFGRLYGIAVTNTSKNKTSAVLVASQIAGVDFLRNFHAKNVTTFTVPPVRRDLLVEKPADPYLTIFYDAALSSRGWVDPSPAETTTIFRDMINDILSNTLSVNLAVSKASGRITQLIGKMTSQ